MKQASLSKWEQKVQHFSRSRAHILQAIHDKPGMTYVEIRLWIHERYRYWMENVGARCRELYGLGYARKTTDDGGRVHVYAVEKET